MNSEKEIVGVVEAVSFQWAKDWILCGFYCAVKTHCRRIFYYIAEIENTWIDGDTLQVAICYTAIVNVGRADRCSDSCLPQICPNQFGVSFSGLPENQAATSL